MTTSAKHLKTDHTSEAYQTHNDLSLDLRLVFPVHGIIGILLMSTSWYLSWMRPEGFTFIWENAFFPLWFGYILVVDGLNVLLKGNSLFTRNSKAFWGLFIASIFCWWLFEFLNLFLNNWVYVLNRPVGPLEYAIRSSINFSIVTPAVFETAELLSSSKPLSLIRKKQSAPLSMTIVTRNLFIGIVWLVLVIGFPRYAFPLAWGAIFLIIDVINYLNNAPSIHGEWAKGERRIIWSLALGSLICGFFWEMWNYFSIPKWIYKVPFVDFYHVFEMPILGFIGYLPFGLEVFALYFFVMYAFGFKKTAFWDSEQYIRL
ncbi:hypothetical protein GF406_22445 [candidate division KSB1 bacterium]|nr:hypothetical protein [candidate division KSB1 bacterium]